ncbi:MAG: tetratricopeptide repeat protein [Bryobacteraceae bacterium]|nr:tetratricopeptide repeat protein [Bryobacteraceae bacterium]
MRRIAGVALAIWLLGAPSEAQGQADRDLSRLLEAHKAQPQDWKLCQQIGVAYVEAHQLEKALEYFQKAAELNPGFAPARKNAATVQWFLGRKDESERVFRALAKEIPADPVPRLYLGLAAYERRRYAEAKEHFEKAGDLALNNPEVQPAVFETYLAMGDQYDREGKPEAAYEAYRKAISCAPRMEDGYVALASFAADHQNQEFALKVLEEGIGKVPGGARLRLQRGLIQALQGKQEEAEASFLESSRLDPKSNAAELARGVLRLENGEYAEAAEAFRRAAAMAPDDYRAEYLYATALGRTGGAEAEVTRALEKAVRLKPDDAPSRAALGKAYADARRVEEAAKQLEKALELNPAHATALYQLGRLYRKLGRPEDSRKLLARFEEVKATEGRDEWKMVQVLRVAPGQ